MGAVVHCEGMVEVAEIKDRDSLQAWLLDRPLDETKKFAITIAHRAAMRLLPVYWEWVKTWEFAKKHDLIALSILRCNLISGVARVMPTPEIINAGSPASAVAITACAAPRFVLVGTAETAAITAEIAATATAAVASLAVPDIDAASDASFAASLASSVPATANWKQIRNDCAALQSGDLLLAIPLWHSDQNPFQKEWDAVHQSLTKRQGYGLKYDGASNFDGAYNHGEDTGGTQTVDWSFWINWYQDALEGREPNWEMLEEIAGIGEDHPITEQDWKKGPARVNFLIGEIQAKYLSAHAPLAERVEFNPQSARFHTTPQEPKKPDLLAATLSQVEDAKEDALADAGNGLREDSREVRVLDRTIQRYSNDPQRIEMDFTSVAIGLRRQIEETQELPKSEGNLALLEAVEEGARAIRVTHPDVAENRMIFAGQALRELPKEDIAVLDEAKEVLVAISEGAMSEDFAEDIPELINDALLPLPNGAPPLPGMDPAVRVFGRVSRMAMMMQKSGEIVEQVEKSKSFRALKIVKMGATVYGWLSSLVSIGLRLFGIL